MKAESPADQAGHLGGRLLSSLPLFPGREAEAALKPMRTMMTYTTDSAAVNKISTSGEQSARGIGDNGGPSLYLHEIGKLQAIDAVLKNPRFNQTEALVLIGLIIRSDSNYANAFPGAGTLALYAKVKKTDQVFKALKQLEDHFAMLERKSRGQGRSNTYTIIPQRVVDDIVKEFDQRKASATNTTHPLSGGAPLEQPTPYEGAGLTKTHPSTGGDLPQKPTPPQGVTSVTHPLRGGPTHPLAGGTYPFHTHPDKKEREAHARPPQPKNTFVPINWTTALNPSAAHDAEDVFWVDGCKIEVVNGFKVELQTHFPNVDLVSGLAIVAGEAKPNVVGTDLKTRIRRKFGYLQNDEVNKDRRYGQRAAAGSSPQDARTKADMDWGTVRRQLAGEKP